MNITFSFLSHRWRIHRSRPLFSERHGYERVFRIGRTAIEARDADMQKVYAWCALLGHEWNDTAVNGFRIVCEQTCRRCAEKRHWSGMAGLPDKFGGEPIWQRGEHPH